ncbi:hypothetical protein B0H17DRAFT_1195850 [Mycena rosella]|uniref:Uncharacterized protein n=1 Tax=Mycena rosella TaxID=1033263 RepID=A0AAD7GLM2_MYCRO|nr:hypothetical protein B0H17DRAFT_1195850 [Mycena rosella]
MPLPTFKYLTPSSVDHQAASPATFLLAAQAGHISRNCPRRQMCHVCKKEGCVRLSLSAFRRPLLTIRPATNKSSAPT